MALTNTITYGAYTFPFASMTVQSGVLYAPDGFTQIGTRYFFVVSGWVGGTSQGDLNTQIGLMEGNLRTPRLAFRVNWAGDGNVTLYSFDNTGSDINWGPKPIDLELTRFSGGRVAMYRWTVEVTSKVMQCSTLATDVLAITWQFQHAIDPSGFTTRTVSGQLLVDSNAVQDGSGADHWRATLTNALPCPLWFQRIQQEFTQSEDGRVVSFSIVDQEKYWTFPTPITNGQVSWMVRVPDIFTASNLLVDYILSGWFETSAAHSKQEILNAVYNLAAVKFGGITGTVIAGERVFREDVYGSRVEFSLHVRAAAGTNANGEIDYSVGLATFTLAPPGSNGRPILINPYGQTDGLTSGVIASAPVTYDACSTNGYQFKNQNQPVPGGVATGGNGSTGGQGASAKDITKGVSNIQLKNPYIAFHEQVSYELDNHQVILPVKSANADPIIQQTAAPTLIITQAGYFKQIAETANDVQPPPSPIPYGKNKNSSNMAMMNYYVSPATPEPVSDGSYNLYTVEWRYVMAWTKKLTDQSLTDVEPQFPSDPRRPVQTGAGGNGGDLPQLPQVVAVPQS